MPRLLGPYVLETELGRGGVGHVHRARRTTGEVRAVKVLEGAPPDVVVRFRREVEALARAAGDGVVPVHESGVEGRTLWYAMDLAPGSLRDLARRGPVPWREAARIVARVARTLARCHALGLVHRDVKPENVLLDAEGEPRLSDFGCALLAGDARLTLTGELLGTPAYLAPEQLAGEALDARLAGAPDVFAAGVLLHELIAGERPFDPRNPVEHVAAVRARRRPRLAGVPPELAGIVDEALAFAPADRPTASALAQRLERLVAGERRRSSVPLVAAVAVLAVAALAATRRPAADAPPPASPPPPPPPPVVRTTSETAALESLVFASLAPGDPSVVPVDACEALVARSRSPRAHALLARTLLAAGDVEAALAQSGAALAMDPDEALALAVRARVAAQRGALVARFNVSATEHTKDALATAGRALLLDPRLADAWYALTIGLALLGDFDAADSAAGGAIEGRPFLVDSLLLRAQVRCLADPRAAAEDWRRAQRLDPRLIEFDARVIGGSSAFEWPTHRRAVASDATSLVVRALDPAATEAQARAAVAALPRHSVAWLALAKNPYVPVAERFAAARESLRRDAYQLHAWRFIAVHLATEGNVDDAIAACDRVLEIEGPGGEISLRRAWLLAGRHDAEGAVAALDAALLREAGRTVPMLETSRAHFLVLRGELGRAEGAARAAIELPGHPDGELERLAAFGLRARIRAERGDGEGALADAALALAPARVGLSYPRPIPPVRAHAFFAMAVAFRARDDVALERASLEAYLAEPPAGDGAVVRAQARLAELRRRGRRRSRRSRRTPRGRPSGRPAGPTRRGSPAGA